LGLKVVCWSGLVACLYRLIWTATASRPAITTPHITDLIERISIRVDPEQAADTGASLPDIVTSGGHRLQVRRKPHGRRSNPSHPPTCPPKAGDCFSRQLTTLATTADQNAGLQGQC
jgi:hypothetical protein